MSNPFGQNIIACVWDFDKTLIPGYMQTPLFDHYGVKEAKFWDEVNSLPEIYSRRGCKVSKDTIYLNHLLSYVKNGPMRGLTNQKLHQLGGQLEFCNGLPELFEILSTIPNLKASSAEKYLDILPSNSDCQTDSEILNLCLIILS